MQYKHQLVFVLIIRDYALFSALTVFVIYIYYWNLQFLKNVIIIKAKIYRDNEARTNFHVLVSIDFSMICPLIVPGEGLIETPREL